MSDPLARETLEALAAECRPHARALGWPVSLEQVLRLAAESGAERQRAIAAGTGTLDHLVATLADRFLAPAWTPRLPGKHANIDDTPPKGAAHVPLARLFRIPHPPERSALRRA